MDQLGAQWSERSWLNESLGEAAALRRHSGGQPEVLGQQDGEGAQSGRCGLQSTG